MASLNSPTCHPKLVLKDWIVAPQAVTPAVYSGISARGDQVRVATAICKITTTTRVCV